MRVFISWSKPLSGSVARALNTWLPQVLQKVEPFLSSEMDPGSRWSSTIAAGLDESAIGIVCVTRENRHEPWLNFEAGALAKSVDGSHVIPLLIDLTPVDLDGPLSQFQAVTTLDRDGVASVVGKLNGLLSDGLSDVRLEEAIDVWWPRLETSLTQALGVSGVGATEAPPLRDQRELLEELVTMVRSLVEDTRSVPANPPVKLRGAKSPGRQVVGARLWKASFKLGIQLRLIEFLDDRRVRVTTAAPPSYKPMMQLDAIGKDNGVTVDWRVEGQALAESN